jgi:rhamnose utilization protein RhaD (predicted bifunctional aldolase and dehydrogenase)
MQELDHFVKLSKFAGERFDLTQAGGGNSSVKFNDGTMLIKASGYLLSEVSHEKAYASLDNRKLLPILEDKNLHALSDKKQREAFAQNGVNAAMLKQEFRPSIETLLHAVLHKYVLHTHPVAVNAFTCRSTWKKDLSAIFPEALFVGYATPGLELTLELKRELAEYAKTHAEFPDLIFLKNHGVIIGSEDPMHIYTRYNEVTEILSNKAHLDLARFKNCNKVSALINSVTGGFKIAFLSEDSIIQEFSRTKRHLLFTPPFCPDTFVFGGLRPFELKDPHDQQAVVDFKSKNHDFPKVVIWNEQVFFIADHLKKAREMEDVFKFHLLAASGSGGDIQPIEEEELNYLGNWEAEKFRQKL